MIIDPLTGCFLGSGMMIIHYCGPTLIEGFKFVVTPDRPRKRKKAKKQVVKVEDAEPVDSTDIPKNTTGDAATP
jgi:hypothetical protein